MFLASTVVSALLAALLAFSAIRKLSHDPPVVQSYATAGVPESWLNTLAWVLLAGAAALMIGLAWGPLGVVAAGALLIYFGVAISFHLPREMPSTCRCRRPWPYLPRRLSRFELRPSDRRRAPLE
jgi:uncharacterized membrane protein YphA (DoxX/SURF4 family)